MLILVADLAMSFFFMVIALPFMALFNRNDSQLHLKETERTEVVLGWVSLIGYAVVALAFVVKMQGVNTVPTIIGAVGVVTILGSTMVCLYNYEARPTNQIYLHKIFES